MILLIIILFFIIILTTLKVKIDIEKLEIDKSKIKYRAKIKIYILKYIKIFQKRIKKKDLSKIFFLFKKKGKRIKNSYFKMRIAKLDLKISYGMSNVFANIYIYAILNALVPMIISANGVDSNNRNYNINTDFKNNYFYVYLKGILELRC